jgi:DNA-binding transcriptional ArsR family regulator
MSKRKLPLTDRMMELVAARFRALSEPVRLRILQVLEESEMTVGGIVESLGANQSNVSRHLQSLHDAGLVGRRREGSNVIYFIADPTVGRICEIVCRRAEEEVRAQLAELGATMPGRRNR